MRSIIYTQRVEVIQNYDERRDCADQNIPKFLYTCGFSPVSIMNDPTIALQVCKEIVPKGIFFSGGNDLYGYGGNAPERDETEKLLLEYAVANKIPLLGICRGMQFIAHYYGCKLKPVENHVKKDHSIHGKIERNVVNSFHCMGVLQLTDPLIAIGCSKDGVVEALQHKSEAIAGIMWHPERVEGFDRDDIAMVKKFYEKGSLI